ncbi:glycosyltransferase family 2 protein [Paenibacillus pseudetheri]|uniref:Glycosyltransferase 2-like domain-containing protein n=1 Tax=Paenibacillus pseudetheri TaxID=2897682 RepID=A0ABN8FNH2_9BACL|nr:glycosyltransferase family 2 protein [Paenibacillus pseudetheri]CAH1059499.1 hypothetical protein PAECIP111894_05708 [Paenibacillus pseudetheri]
MGKVQILLSTYNGEKYLDQQLESILEQSYKNISILIRDDGSNDSTIDIITSYTIKHPDIISFIKAQNSGVIDSFLELIKHSYEDCEYYCFCDQDDIWLPHKIELAVKKLSGIDSSIPSMYFTATYPTSDMLTTQKVWPSVTRKPGLYNALIENIAVGATITFNKAAMGILKDRIPNASNIIMHDWWLYIVVSSLGTVIYDETPSILYRQHESNVVGADTSFIRKFKKKWIRFKSNKNKRYLYRQALEFHTLYSSLLNDNKKNQLDLFLLPRKKLQDKLYFLRHSKLYRQTYSENLIFKFLVLIGYI